MDFCSFAFIPLAKVEYRYPDIGETRVSAVQQVIILYVRCWVICLKLQSHSCHPFAMLTRTYVSGSLNCSVRNARPRNLSQLVLWQRLRFTSDCCLWSESSLLCVFMWTLPTSGREDVWRLWPWSASRVPGAVRAPGLYKYSLFQTCELGDCHHFTEEPVEPRGVRELGCGPTGTSFCCSTSWSLGLSGYSTCPDTWPRAAICAQPILSWLHVSCSGFTGRSNHI